MSPRMLAVLLVSAAVGMNLVSAVMLKTAADMQQAPWPVIVALILLVLFINLLRVYFWSAIHKRFRLSDSYPLTSLFFPLILLTSALYGEEIGVAELIGTALITSGVLVLMDDKLDASAEEPAREPQ